MLFLRSKTPRPWLKWVVASAAAVAIVPAVALAVPGRSVRKPAAVAAHAPAAAAVAATDPLPGHAPAVHAVATRHAAAKHTTAGRPAANPVRRHAATPHTTAPTSHTKVTKVTSSHTKAAAKPLHKAAQAAPATR